MRRFLIISTIGCLAALTCASCRKSGSPRATPAASETTFQVRKTFGTGPVQFTIELSRSSITTADALRCRMVLDVAKDYEAEFPDIAFPEDVPGSILTDYEEHESTRGDRRISRRDYEIEPEYEGKLTLPKMEVYSHRVGEVKEEVLETEPIEVTVAATPETAADLELRPVRGLVTVEQIEARQKRRWPWIVGGAAGVLAAAALIIYLARRPRPAPPPPPAHETALKRLRQLADRGLIAAGAAEAFFVEVTAIIREYIEQGFGVRAPEQTTEEFLAGMVRAPVVARHRHVLEPFLVAADEVKFACMQPDSAAMQRAFATAEKFVIESSGAREDSRTSGADSRTSQGGQDARPPCMQAGGDEMGGGRS
jgi:hypothetical protein